MTMRSSVSVARRSSSGCTNATASCGPLGNALRFSAPSQNPVYNWVMQKQCSKCQQVKPLNEFHRYKRSADGHKSRCKPCNTADTVQWQRKNKEQYMARYSVWVDKNRDKARAAVRRWNERNRGVAHQRKIAKVGREAENKRLRDWSAANREKTRAWKARWKKANPEAVAAFSGKRRAALKNAIPAWANEQAILDIYRECRNHPNHHVDHIVPLVSKIVCGLHCEANLRIIPAVENYSKNNRRWPDMP